MSVVCSAPCSHQYNLRIHWRHSTIWGTSKKSVWSNVFWYLKVYIFWKYIQYTIHWDKKIFKKISSGKINGTKTVHFFLSRALTRHSFTFNLRILYELKHQVRLSKAMWDFPFSIPFRFCDILYFCLPKCMDSLTLKRLNPPPPLPPSFAPRRLIFKLEQEV